MHQVTLTTFSDCNALDSAIVDTVVLQMQSQLQMVEEGYFYPVPLAGGGESPDHFEGAGAWREHFFCCAAAWIEGAAAFQLAAAGCDPG